MAAQTELRDPQKITEYNRHPHAITTKKENKSKRIIFFKRRVWWIVFGVPNILSVIYFGVIATPRYVSESSLVVYQANQTDSARPVTVQLSANGGGVSLEGDYLAAKYMRSWKCFANQNPKKLAAAWSKGDFVSRFGGLLDLFQRNPTVLWRYYQNHVVTTINKSSAIMTVRVIGFDQDFAKTLNASVLSAADAAVNNMNGQAFENAETFFENRVASAQKHLREAILKLSDLQKKNHVVDPGAAYQAQLSLLNNLIDKKITMEAQFKVFERATPDSQRVNNLRVELQSLEQQIARTSKTIHGENSALTSISGPYSFQKAKIKNAESTLKENEYQLIAAQQTALQHQYFMEYVDKPTVPPNPTQPYRLEWILVILGVTFSLYVVVK